MAEQAVHQDHAADRASLRVERATAAAAQQQATFGFHTRRLYASDWTAFAAWCREAGQVALPAASASVAAYLSSLSGSLGPGALARRAAAIADRHRRAGHASPSEDTQVRAVLRAARVARHPADGASGKRQARAAARPRRRTVLSTAQLARMAGRCPGDLAGLRDRALLLLTCAGLHAEQLLALDREHVQLSSHQVTLILVAQDDGTERAKVPPAAADGTPAEGEVRVLPRGTNWTTCPVRALDQWLQGSDTRFGPVFRKVDRWGNVEHHRLRLDALRRIWKRRAAAVRAARDLRPAADPRS